MSAVGTSALHYFSVMQKPIAGGLLLSRARFLFGFWRQSYEKNDGVRRSAERKCELCIQIASIWKFSDIE